MHSSAQTAAFLRSLGLVCQRANNNTRQLLLYIYANKPLISSSFTQDPFTSLPFIYSYISYTQHLFASLPFIYPYISYIHTLLIHFPSFHLSIHFIHTHITHSLPFHSPLHLHISDQTFYMKCFSN